MARKRKPRIRVTTGVQLFCWLRVYTQDDAPPSVVGLLKEQVGNFNNVCVPWRYYEPTEGRCLKCSARTLIHEFGICDRCFALVSLELLGRGLLMHVSDDITRACNRRRIYNSLRRIPDGWVTGGEVWRIVPGKEEEFDRAVQEIEKALDPSGSEIRKRKPLALFD